MGKMAITINGAEPKNLYPAFTLASSALATGDDVILFFTPSGAPALKKGFFETIKAKGLPDMADLVEGFTDLDGRLLMCELGFEAKDMKEEDLREGVEIVGATTFIVEAQGSELTFSF